MLAQVLKSDKGKIYSGDENVLDVFERLLRFDYDREQRVGVGVRHRGERLDVFIFGIRTGQNGHPALALRMILRALDKVTSLGPRLEMWRDQALASGIEQPRNILVLQVRNPHDRRNPRSMRMRDHVHHGLEVEPGMLSADEDEVQTSGGQRVNHAASPGLPYEGAEGKAA